MLAPRFSIRDTRPQIASLVEIVPPTQSAVQGECDMQLELTPSRQSATLTVLPCGRDVVSLVAMNSFQPGPAVALCT